MNALGKAGFPVPHTFAFCEDEGVIGSPFYIMAMVEGRTLWDGRLPDTAPAQRSAIYEAQIDTLAALHRLNPAEAGLAAFGVPGGEGERRVGKGGVRKGANGGLPG